MANDVYGTNLSEILRGTRLNDCIHAYGGNDLLFDGDGNDRLFDDQGSDRLHGGNGEDIANDRYSNSGVFVEFDSGRGAGGDAEGDRYVSIENGPGLGP